MLARKNTKSSRMRGSKTHSWGHKKKHRGKGNKGGTGMAGSGARADSKKPTLVAMYGNKYLGKRGFTSVKKKDTNVFSLGYLESNFEKMVEDGEIQNDNKGYTFDATSYDKVLGNEKLSNSVTVICNNISSSARKSIEDAGGEVKVKGEE